jgi:hypothetical protein
MWYLGMIDRELNTYDFNKLFSHIKNMSNYLDAETGLER